MTTSLATGSSPCRNPLALLVRAAGVTSLMLANSAHAGLLLTSIEREVSAFAEGDVPGFDSTNLSVGAYSAAVASGNGSARARATQDSNIGTSDISADLFASSSSFIGALANAQSRVDIFFTLTSSYQYAGTAFRAIGGNSDSDLIFFIEDIANGIVTHEPQIGSGLLGPGDYRLFLAATSSVTGAVQSGFAQFGVDISFTEVATQEPDAVPEPDSLVLALAGVLACGAARRRRPASA